MPRAALLLFLPGLLAAQEPPVHLEAQSHDLDRAPATLQLLQDRIDAAEEETRHPQRLPTGEVSSDFEVDRTILSDTCAAADQTEHARIGLGALVMLLAVSKDPSELPLRHVALVQPDGQRRPLRPVAALPEKLCRRLRLAGPIGTHAQATLYWVPRAFSIQGRVLADFATHRKDFSAGVSFPLGAAMGAGLKDAPGAVFSVAALQAMVAREYPGFELLPDLKAVD